MSGAQDNQINFFAASEEDNLFGDIALQYNLGHATVAPNILGYPLAEALPRTILKQSIVLYGLQHAQFGTKHGGNGR